MKAIVARGAQRIARGTLVLSMLVCAIQTHASEREDTLINRNTTLNLIEALVQRGILDRASADAMILEAQEKAVRDAQAELAGAAPARTGGDDRPAVDDDAVHVYYIPQAVKDQLGREVGDKLREQVVAEVKSEARQEAWGVPAALPAWVNRFALTGDLRMRGEAHLFAADNQEFSYLDWPAINDAGGLLAAGPDAFANTTVDRVRFRSRLRLGIDATITEGLKAGIRVNTSNDRSPVSLDQTMGQTGRQYELALDRVFLQYDHIDDDGYDWVSLWAGRHVNPWFSTETLYDRDLSFEGLAGSFRLRLGDGPVSSTVGGGPAGNWGFSQSRSLFLTLGASPLEEVELSPHDKWLFAGQAGIDWGFADRSRFKLGLAYYDFANVAAQPNVLGSRSRDFTAPEFFTKGNSLVRISNDIGETIANPRLVGLAADFDILDVTGSYDLAYFAPLHLIATGSFSRNIGFDRKEILRRTGVDIKPRTSAYELRLDFGHPAIRLRHEWNIALAYKYLQRDAVLDAYTESTFHLGGTDTKGWIVGASYGVATNTWLQLRWQSADAIDGPPLGVDTLQLDFNTGF